MRMSRFNQKSIHAAACFALALAGQTALASDVVTKVTNFGTVALPFSTNYGSTFTASSPLTPGDTFYEDYGFVVADGSFSSISATFNLDQVLQITGLQARVFRGDPWTGSTPGTLSSADILVRWQTVTSSSGTGSYQIIAPTPLAAGHYVLEVRGQVTGSAGGSYAGVFNVAAVPEPQGIVLAFAGLGLLALTGTRRRNGG
jgi:hypothetical protein